MSLEREEDCRIDKTVAAVAIALAWNEEVGVDGVGDGRMMVVGAKQRTEVFDQLVGNRYHHLCLAQCCLEQRNLPAVGHAFAKLHFEDCTRTVFGDDIRHAPTL